MSGTALSLSNTSRLVATHQMGGARSIAVRVPPRADILPSAGALRLASQSASLSSSSKSTAYSSSPSPASSSSPAVPYPFTSEIRAKPWERGRTRKKLEGDFTRAAEGLSLSAASPLPRPPLPPPPDPPTPPPVLSSPLGPSASSPPLLYPTSPISPSSSPPAFPTSCPSYQESPSTPFALSNDSRFSTPSTSPPHAPASPIFRRRDSPPPAAASLVLRSTTARPNPVPPLRTIQCPPSHRAHFANGTATVVPIATHPTQPQPTLAYPSRRNPAASTRPRPLELAPPQPSRTASVPCAYRSPRRAESAEVHGVMHQPPPDRLTASAALRRRQKATGIGVGGGEEG